MLNLLQNKNSGYRFGNSTLSASQPTLPNTTSPETSTSSQAGSNPVALGAQPSIDTFQKNNMSEEATLKEISQELIKSQVPNASPEEVNAFSEAAMTGERAGTIARQKTLAQTGNQNLADEAMAYTIFNESEKALRSTEAGRSLLTKMAAQAGKVPPDFSQPFKPIAPSTKEQQPA